MFSWVISSISLTKTNTCIYSVLILQIPIALDMAKDSKDKDRELKKRMSTDNYMRCAIRECYLSFKSIINFLVLGEREKKWVQYYLNMSQNRNKTFHLPDFCYLPDDSSVQGYKWYLLLSWCAYCWGKSDNGVQYECSPKPPWAICSVDWPSGILIWQWTFTYFYWLIKIVASPNHIFLMTYSWKTKRRTRTRS